MSASAASASSPEQGGAPIQIPGEVLTIDLAVAGARAAVPLLVLDPLAAIEQAAGGVRFDLANRSTLRLVQFGNRQSSKSRQGSYSLRLREAGKIAITVDPGQGVYGDGCQLCVQLYDADHAFLTQLRIPLSSGRAKQSFDTPAQAVHGCFTLHLQGQGVASDLTVEIVAKGFRTRDTIGLHSSIRSSEEFLSMLRDGPEGRVSLRETALNQPEFVVAALKRWSSERMFSEIIQFLEIARGWEPGPRLDRVLAYLLLFSARAYSNLNCSPSGLAVLNDLMAIDGWRALLDPREAHGAVLLEANLKIRDGRADDGVEALNAARLTDPTHWEAYFLLANNLGEEHALLRDAFYEAAATLYGAPHAKITVALVENHLRRGRWPEAFAKALAGVSETPGPHDVWLALANVHRNVGDAAGWRRFLESYFEQYGLMTPAFGDGADFAAIAGGGPAATPPMPGRGATVAVVMTTFNSENTVELAARSVLAQTHGDIILAIVDDCSSDATVEIARRLAESDPRVRLLQSEANSGTYVCKNLALMAIEADFYTFHDSDDWMHPERIARHAAAMEATGAACTTSLWFRMSPEGWAVARHSGGYQHSNPASMFVSREVIRRIGYFDSVRTGADTEFVWRVRNRYGHAKTLEIRLPLGIGMHHDASLTQSGAAAFDRHRYSEVRSLYWESWVKWHLETLARAPEELHLTFPLGDRSFFAPSAITPEGGRAPAEDSIEVPKT